MCGHTLPTVYRLAVKFVLAKGHVEFQALVERGVLNVDTPCNREEKQKK
jgi:hypothetical protein